MRYCILLLLAFALAACGGTAQPRDEGDDDGPYTSEDLENETGDVYRPEDDGRSETPKKEPEPKVEAPKKEEPAKGPKVETPKKEEPKKEEPRKEPGPKVETPKKEEPKKEEPKKEEPKKEEPKKDPPANARSALVSAFIADVGKNMDTLEQHKLWKEFVKAREKFDDRVDKAKEKQRDEKGKDLEEAWANAIVAWYEVRYTYELWMHLNWKAAKEFDVAVGFNLDGVQEYTDAELKSAACAQTKAAYELAEPEMKEVRQFQTDVLKYDLVASRVFVDAKQAKKWEKEKKLWQDATEGKYDENELKKYR